MNHSVLPVFFAGMILLLVLAVVPVNAESSTITSISPPVGYTSKSTTVTITGTNFNTSSVEVRLMMDDETNITSSITSHTNTSIVCRFTISSSKELGAWDLVVINMDESEVVKRGGFTIRNPMTLTSIVPRDARTNNESVDVTIVGTGLDEVSDLYLYNKDYDNITATLDDVTSKKVTGTFDLTDAEMDTYKVCVLDDFGIEECDLSFEVTTDEVGSIDISSSPSGASIFVDGSPAGTTPDTVDNLDEGSYKLILKKSGYNDWGKVVKVTAGDTKTVDADLVAITTVPTTVRTAIPTTVPTTVRTTRTSTIAVPTTWPSATATSATASPLDPMIVTGAAALCFGLVGIRRHK